MNKPQTIREIQTDAVLEPFQEKQVATSGVVTWADSTMGNMFYVQDGTGGIQVTYEGRDGPKPEDEVEILGIVRQGPFSPVIAHASFVRVHKASLPGPKKTSSGGIVSGVSLGERVELGGRVRTARMLSPSVLGFELMSDTSLIFVRVSNAEGVNPDELVACRVRARGVVHPARARGFNKQLIEVQILVNDLAEFFVDNRPVGDPWADPLVSLARAFQYRPGKSQGDRWHVSGQVVLVLDGVVYLNDGQSGLEVRGQDVERLVPGSWVEAVGFPDLVDHLPVLSHTVFGPASKENPHLRPVDLPSASLLDGLRHASHVSVTGMLLDRMLTPSKTTSEDGKPGGATLVLGLQSPQGVFNAELRVEGTPDKLPEIEVGSMLKIDGVCLVQTNSSGDAVAFKLLVPSVSDITVLSKAGFFTVKRLLVILSLVLAVLLLVAATAFLLARRNIRLLAEVRERQVVAAERSRIARDLHDGLEQGLMGINLQLYGKVVRLCSSSSELQEWLGTVRGLVYRCHAEMRKSIWNLRSNSLERYDLGEALERIARSLSVGTPLEIEISREKSPRKLPPMIEDDLLRIGQEALTNVVKHSGATRLRISLQVSSDEVTLAVSDNGRGLRVTAAGFAKSSSFGVLGMSERAARMGGEFEIANGPESGCTVRVRVPLNPPATSENAPP